MRICDSMFNQECRSYKVTFLCVTVCLSLSFMCSTWYTDNQRKSVARMSHVSVNIRENITEKDAFFEAAMSQIHQQLGNATDVLMVFEEAPLKQRKEHVNQMCSWMRKFDKARGMARVSYYENINVLFCSVPKVGTKFWFRMLHVLETGEFISPFEIQDGPKTRYHITSDKKSETRDRINSARKIIFTRDPYKRIFSSYVDKLVSPNGAYWAFGRKIIQAVRKPESSTMLQCGHDVQFGELVKYLIKTDAETYDVHFKPVSSQCDVCDIHYDMIGKVETFKHDVMYVLNMTNASEKGVMFKNFLEEKNVDNIIFKVRRAFKMKKKSLKCISDHMVHLRLWRVLQIGGLIDKYDEYPLNPDESREANATVIINLMLSAYERSSSKARLNKQEALLQAYSQVPMEDLEQLRLKYLKDLLLFDYEDRPSYLFNRKDSATSDTKTTFDYYDVMRLRL